MARKQKSFKRRWRAEWEVIVAEYRSSGLSMRQFAQKRGVGEASLARWSRLLRSEEEQGIDSTCEPGLIELVTQQPASVPEVEDTEDVRLLVGRSVCLQLPRWPTPDYVALIARAYEAMSPC